MRIRDLGYTPGQLSTGPRNSILDVRGVTVGQVTVSEGGNDVRKGVTIIMPRHPDDINTPCYAGMHTLNGNGEVTGSYQIKDWGYINTPIALTNSLSLGNVFDALWCWMLERAKTRGQSSHEMGRHYGTPVVGETADWGLNDPYRTAVAKAHIFEAIESAATQEAVQEGSYGGGAGMTCHQFTGGTGTASRITGGEGKDYTVGVLIQSNYGHLPDLQIGGVPIGKLLAKEKKVPPPEGSKRGDGSIVIVIFTDAPLLPHQLCRLAQRASIGLAQVGGHGVGRNHSGDIFLAVSTGNKPDEHLTGPNPDHRQPLIETNTMEMVRNESVDALFRAASEATEEAILNSLVGAREGRTGYRGVRADGLPVERVAELLKEHLVVI